MVQHILNMDIPAVYKETGFTQCSSATPGTLEMNPTTCPPGGDDGTLRLLRVEHGPVYETSQACFGVTPARSGEFGYWPEGLVLNSPSQRWISKTNCGTWQPNRRLYKTRKRDQNASSTTCNGVMG